MSTFLTVGAVACIGLGAAYLYLRKKGLAFPKAIPPLAPEVKTIDGTLSFNDVVGWFKTLPDLQQGRDTPFIAKVEVFKGKIKYTASKPQAVLLGVYQEEAKAIVHAILLECDRLDDKTIEVLGEESLVCLS